MRSLWSAQAPRALRQTAFALDAAVFDLAYLTGPVVASALAVGVAASEWVVIAIVAAAVLPTAASAGCYNCYTPQPCATCYQQQYVPPQYRAWQETVMVSPGAVVAHRTPAQYRTVMVPQTVMVAPGGVAYEHIPPQYATQERVEMVSPGYSYYAPVMPRCASCGY